MKLRYKGMVLALLTAFALLACGGSSSSPALAPSGATAHQVTITWDTNREADVNRAGGGYTVAISGQPAINVSCPCPVKPSTKTTLMSGSYSATVTAHTAINSTDGLAGTTNSRPSTALTINVP